MIVGATLRCCRVAKDLRFTLSDWNLRANADSIRFRTSVSGRKGIVPDTGEFLRRCQSSGVVKCVGFDSPSDIEPFLSHDGEGLIRGTLDKTIKASGAGSLRFEIPSHSGQNSSGSWVSGMGGTFGPGDTFYVQFRQRFDKAMISTNFGGNGWKQAVFHTQPTGCGSIELTTQNTYLRGFPQMYTDCGARGFEIPIKGGADFLLQQGDYNCKYSNRNPKDCSMYHPDQWMTFYYEIKLGQWGTPTSSIQAWVAYEGEPLKKFIDIRNYVLNFNDGPADRYDTITLMPYNTHKPWTQTNPVAYTWYDELIVSKQPIPPPAGPTPP